MKAITRSIDYQTAQGAWRTLRPCSVMNIQRLSDRYNELIKHFDQMPGEMTFEEAYTDDSYFNFLCNTCLELGGVDPAECNMDMVIMFLFPHNAGDGLIRDKGILMYFNFPKRHKAKEFDNKKDADALEGLIANMWLATEDLTKTLELLEILNPDDLNTIMAKRNEALMPEDQKLRKRGYEDAMDIMEQKGLIAKQPGDK